MAKNTSTSYGLIVSLKDEEANAITLSQPTGQTASDKLSLVAGSLLRDLARGGVMIAPEWAARVETAIGTVDTTAIVEAVEKSVNRIGDAVVVPWVVDPTQIAFYNMQAENANMSLERQLKAHLDLAYASGWLGASAPDACTLLLTPEQYRQLQALFGKDVVTGADVMSKIGESIEIPNDDLILDSLREA